MRSASIPVGRAVRHPELLPITHAPDVDGRKLFCHETTIGYDLNADSWSGATIGPDFWAPRRQGRPVSSRRRSGSTAWRSACVRLGIEAPGLTGREALPIPKGVNVAPQPSAQAEGREGRGDQDGVRRDRRREAYLGFTLPVCSPSHSGRAVFRGRAGSIFCVSG